MTIWDREIERTARARARLKRRTMAAIDFNMIQALISQAPAEDLVKVKKIVDDEMQW
jgi:hypothetical protein